MGIRKILVQGKDLLAIFRELKWVYNMYNTLITY